MPQKSNFLNDVALPLVALLSSSSGGNGAATAQLLGTILNRRPDQPGSVATLGPGEIAPTRQPLQIQSQQDQLKEAQAGFQLGNLQDIFSQVNEPGPGAGATLEALGPAQTGRLQSALGRGEQVPLPVEPTTPRGRQERLGGLATSPAGRAQLEAAGLGAVAKAGDTTEFAREKRELLGAFTAIPAGQFDPELLTTIRQQVAGANTQDELTDAVAALPIGLGARQGSIEEQIFRELQPTLGSLGALEAVAGAKAPPGLEAFRQASIRRLESDIAKNMRETQGILNPVDRRKLQLEVRGNIRQEPAYKEYQAALGGQTAVEVGARRGDAQGDLSLLNGIVRLLDPGSVVRPSEFETARGAQGLIEQLEVLIPRIEAGEILNPATRLRYLNLSRQLINEYGATSQAEISQIYGGLLNDTGLSLNEVFVKPRTIETTDAVTTSPARTKRDTTAQSKIREQLKADGMTDDEIDAAIGRNR